MSNSFAQLVQPLLSAAAIRYLNRRNGFLDKIYIEQVQNQNPQLGGQKAIITLPHAVFTSTDVDTANKPTPQGVTLPSVDINFTNWKENVISVSDLESRITRGNAARVIEKAAAAMIDSLLGDVDEAVAALYSSHGSGMTVGAQTDALTDLTVRTAVKKLMDKKVKPQEGDTFLVLDTKGYQIDLMGIDRFVTPLNIGEVDKSGPIITGQIPSLFNMGVDYSHNVVINNVSGTSAAHGMAFERYAIAMGVLDFPPISSYGVNTQVQESFIIDPKTGIKIRSWFYLDPDLRQWVLKYDLCWGVGLLDANRMVEVLYKAE